MSEEAIGAGGAAEVSAVVTVPVEAVVPNPYQPRREFEPAALAELAESIRRHGVLQPIVARRVGSGYELVAGERRLRAARMAGLEQIPARLCVCSGAQVLEVGLGGNL